MDALSIGTQFAVSQMEGQVASWASHAAIRYLFGTTEADDAHPTCYKDLDYDTQFRRIFPHCRKMKYNYNRLMGMRRQFPSYTFLAKHNKTQGWICAQKRFPHALGKLGRFYRREQQRQQQQQQRNNATTTTTITSVLPDFLLIGDDDTWFGINKVTSFLQQQDHTKPFVAAGCMVQWWFQLVNFSFPYGGFGFILNRLAMERLITPIYCRNRRNNNNNTEHAKIVCHRLQENLAGEKMAWKEGMSVSDLMDAHATMLPYSGFLKWKDPGYCMAGDWILGYYVNYYALGSQVVPDLFDYLHIDSQMGKIYKNPERTCLNHDLQKCRKSKHRYACHRMDPAGMLEMTAVDNNAKPRRRRARKKE